MGIIFITGPIGAGKSTLVKKAMEIIRPASPAGLFTTRKADSGEVIITDFHFTREALIGKLEEGKGMVPCPEGFCGLGIEVLDSVTGSDFLVIDELGFLENAAPCFRYKVFKALEKVQSGLVVLKQDETVFLNALKTFPGSRVLTVSRENRDELLYELLDYANAGERRHTG
ncbi:MAG: nucleoside-triphosphatase [Chloroflexi bacterium]|nr:nucleoside-triphosphatase [Chloroflexota bacterium]